MNAPKKPDIPIARLAPKPARTIIPGVATPATHEPNTIPKTVIAPSKPLRTKYLLAMPLALVMRK
jgi:hypothetical protein